MALFTITPYLILRKIANPVENLMLWAKQLNKKQLRKMRSDVQMVLQDGKSALDPRQTIYESMLIKTMLWSGIRPCCVSHSCRSSTPTW